MKASDLNLIPRATQWKERTDRIRVRVANCLLTSTHALWQRHRHTHVVFKEQTKSIRTTKL